jgi:hypothetical protein
MVHIWEPSNELLLECQALQLAKEAFEYGGR